MLIYEWLCVLAPPDLTFFGDSAFTSPHLGTVTIQYRTFPRTGAETPHRQLGLVCGITDAWQLLRSGFVHILISRVSIYRLIDSII